MPVAVVVSCQRSSSSEDHSMPMETPRRLWVNAHNHRLRRIKAAQKQYTRNDIVQVRCITHNRSTFYPVECIGGNGNNSSSWCLIVTGNDMARCLHFDFHSFIHSASKVQKR